MTAVLHDLGGHGDRVVISHATGFHGRAYQPLADLLTDRFHVLALDLPGHGSAPVPPEPELTWMTLAADVSELLAGQPASHLIGHSVGAAVAMVAEARTPGLFRSAYLYEPAILPDGPRPPMHDNQSSVDGARRRRAAFGSLQEVMWRYATRPPLDTLNAACLAAYIEHGFEPLADGSVRLRCLPETEALIYEQTGQIRVEHVRSVDIPVVVAAGGRSGASLIAFLPDLVAALPHGRLEVLPGLDHLGPLEHPAGVVESFLAATT